MKFALSVILISAFLTVFVDARKHCKCYKVIKKPRNDISWENAVEECRWRHGGHLVKINNEAEDMLLKSFLREENLRRGQKGWFIGGKSINGQWKWSDGTNMDYTNFPSQDSYGAAQPNGRVTNYAAIFYDQGAYNWGYVSPRNTDLGYICELNQC